MIPSLQGHLLVASTRLEDPNFFRSVVLMVQHDEMGALGLILNRPTPGSLRDAWEFIDEGDCLRDDSIYHGGPVGSTLLALHNDESLSDATILPGLYVASDKDRIARALRDPAISARLFHGYAGWGPGQLEDELRVGGWLIATANAEMAFYADDDLWEQTIDRIGDQILKPALGKVPSPEDPRVN
ncbi:MAG: YqgE/AlgH family protein [Pirellulales bacterium]